MKKWKIGLIVLGLVSVGLLVYVLIQGASSKADLSTVKSAQAIATKLNKYISNQQEVPASLAKAKIADVPNTIKYTKLPGDKYKFCVTYKAATTDVATDVQNNLTQVALGGGLGGSSSRSYGGSSYNAQSLYIGSDHPAGEQCQTIKPYIYSSDMYNSYNSDSFGSGSYNDNSSYDFRAQ
ncbi:MAG: hypothetical protein ABI220_05855 [Candidatus Saccharimonadales bacterium]